MAHDRTGTNRHHRGRVGGSLRVGGTSQLSDLDRDPTREERLRRGVERDGIAALDDWESWMAGEDAHYERDPTHERADVVIDGTQPVERSHTDRHA